MVTSESVFEFLNGKNRDEWYRKDRNNQIKIDSDLSLLSISGKIDKNDESWNYAVDFNTELVRKVDLTGDLRNKTLAQ